ncbi:efflux RND transporter periplasmic adaptor subunit [Shewanella sp. VB17]|uniref:efflux RND transporter periplasmic adaptor subunit n=1 Tax=Shewanella sp. VB17 TaxID=2739432 RepID=UPI0015676F30|nr:efflux RND transporter periplasmic adaptor subunit [Shewanella sp. VB17]NRD74049.1 efflux RND transporter periplasmic adaptor subunit [Shewanella sp. VB17]
MATKKQIILPIVVLLIGAGGFLAISALKKPLEEKPQIDNTPLVAIKPVEMAPMTFSVGSYGIVKPKYETELVAQVNGEIIFLSNNFVSGGFVSKGDIIARIDPSDYDADLIDAKANLASAKAALVQERAQGKVAEEEWKNIKDGLPTELSLRKPQLAHEIAKLNSSEAGLKRALRNVERTIIRAPYDALIGSRDVGLGSYVSQGSAVGKVLSTAQAEIRLPLADKELRYLTHKGKGAMVEMSATVGGKNQQWPGRIVRSEGVIDSTSRMTYLVAEVADPYGLKDNNNELRYGTYVTAKITGNNAGEVTVLPRHLIVDGKIAVLDKENKLRYKPVTVIRQSGANVVISAGLEQGMNIITSALDYPIEGMQLALPNETILQQDGSEEKETQLAMEEKE